MDRQRRGPAGTRQACVAPDVRPGLSPILSIQGDADPTVPYSHSVRLQEALEKDGVPHQLVTIAGGRHGMFTGDEYVRIYSEIRAFLTKYNLLPR